MDRDPQQQRLVDQPALFDEASLQDEQGAEATPLDSSQGADSVGAPETSGALVVSESRPEPSDTPQPQRPATVRLTPLPETRHRSNYFTEHRKFSAITGSVLALVGIGVGLIATRGSGGGSEHAGRNQPTVTRTHEATSPSTPQPQQSTETSSAQSGPSQAELAELQQNPEQLSLAFFATLAHDTPAIAYNDYTDPQSSNPETLAQTTAEWNRVFVSFQNCVPLLVRATDTYDSTEYIPSVQGLQSKSFHYFVQGNDANYNITIITSYRNNKWWVEEAYWKPTAATSVSQEQSAASGSAG